jgi:acyl-[acyl-carrier-protein]-phospholipid O-acyltransferase/long-chain-fatty-acid--[acyl-carrier-protein] ligase
MKQLHLLTERRFLPLFTAQFLGAFNDNLFKNALVMLAAYRIAAQAGVNGQIVVTLAAGLFILPFFLFSAPAGQLADKYDKSRLIRWIKAAEIAIMAIGAYALISGNLWFLLAVLFLLGVQATFFGPLKYAILPQHLSAKDLLDGNALVEAGTFLAILLGTIVGGLLVLTEGGPWIVGGGAVLLALAGWAASLFLPPAPAASPDLRVTPNFVVEAGRIVRQAAKRRDVFLSILGISWFWLIGATYLSQFPNFTKDVIGADEHVVTLFLTLFSVGIGLGSMLCGRLMKGEISARYVPAAAILMTVFALDLYWATHRHPSAAGPELLGIAAFLESPSNWRISLDLLLLAMAGGVYIVPLYAIVQARTEAAQRARAVAANNIMNALFMVASAVATMLLLAAGVSVPGVFLIVGVANVAVAVYIVRLLPHDTLKTIAAAFFRLLYRVEVHGAEHVTAAGERAVIVLNHVSFLDGPLVAAFLPGRATFAIDSKMAKRWWVRPMFWLVDALTVDPTRPLATKAMIKAVREGRHCVIFPEGRITVTGSLMKVYEGPGLVADKADAPVVPVRIDGAQFTPFSRMRGKLRLRWFPKIRITVLPPRRLEVPGEGLRPRERRRRIGLALYDVMSDLIFETSEADRTLFAALLDARRRYGGALPAVQDPETPHPLTYDRLLMASLVLGRRLARLAAPGEHVGVLLPNAVGVAATFFGLQAEGRVPAMLNFSAGAAAMAAACRTAEIRTVLTSRRFVERAKLDAVVAELERHVQLVYLEDVRAKIGLIDKLYGVVASPFAARLHRRRGRGRKPSDPAVVLFTSGSEGTPKGVVLSHANILANCQQIAARVDFSPSDVVFNALPVFHSFGMTGGLILPLVSGVRTFLYPSPLHYRIVPEMVYGINATIMFGTDTFLAGYARTANPYDFYSIRYVFAGAERVQPATRRAWIEKFGLRIFEGYGATETSPVLAVNTPMHFREGTVGRFLPDIRTRTEPVPGIERGGRLHVSGPNVMLGYLRAERPGVIEPPPEPGWYDTGDIVDIDAEGFATVLGRAKRFAKIAGEMVSLGAAEDLAQTLWPESKHAVVAVADARKGEQLVLVTDRADAGRDALLSAARARGVPELAVPRTILPVDRLPLLGSGKADYPAVSALVAERMAQAA